MAKPYSMDLCERVIAVIMSGQTRESVAWRFEISLSSVGRCIRRFWEQGTLASDKFGGHKAYALAGEEKWLRDWIKKRPDLAQRQRIVNVHHCEVDHLW